VVARKAAVAEEAMSHLLELAQRLMLEALAQQVTEAPAAIRRDGLPMKPSAFRVRATGTP